MSSTGYSRPSKLPGGAGERRLPPRQLHRQDRAQEVRPRPPRRRLPRQALLACISVIGMLLFGLRHLFFWVQFVVWWAPVADAAEYRYFERPLEFRRVLKGRMD